MDSPTLLALMIGDTQMNTRRTNRQRKKDERFERKLNHLQGFVGMPNWNFNSPSFDEIKEYDRIGRQLQHKAKLSFLKRVVKFFKVKKSTVQPKIRSEPRRYNKIAI